MAENANINYGEMIAVADLGNAGTTFDPEGMLAIQGWVDVNNSSQTSDSIFALQGFNSLKDFIQSEVTRLFNGIDGAATEAFYAIDYEIVFNEAKNTFSITVGGSAEWQDWVLSDSFLAAGSIPPAIDYMMMVGGVANNYVNDLKSAGLISLDTELVSAAHSLGASSVQAIAIVTGTFAIGFEPAGIANEIDSI